MKLKISLVIVLLSSVIGFAQPVRSVSYETMLEVAEESLQKNDYYNAIEWYDKAYKESRDQELALNIAQLYLIIRDYKKASKSYNRIFKRDKENLYKEDRILYAKSLKALGSYKEALQEYSRFIDETEDEEMKQIAFMDILGIQELGNYEENISTVLTFMDKKINTRSAESSPTKYNDGKLYFSSFNRKDVIILDGDEGDYFAKIYTIEKNDKDKYDKAVALGSHINREDYHTSNPSFSKDGKRMYFTRTLLDGNEVIESKIFMSYKSSNDWAAANELNINGDFIAKHPVEGALFGNKVLFFSANIEGGEGGFDIYYATQLGANEYATPINLGPSINTDQDELSPFYTDGTLYFSSDGYPSMGGLDIYYSIWDGANWSEITNMGYIYNSSLDDIHFTLSFDGSGGHLVSNRSDKKKKNLKSKTCCDDIYEFSIREVVIDLAAKIRDENGEPLNEGSVALVDITMDSDTTIKSNFASNEFSFLLDSDHKYVAIASRKGYYSDTISFNTLGILDDYTVNKKFKLLAKPVKEPEVEIVTKDKAIRLNNIYYDFDDDKILDDAEIDLSVLYELLETYPDLEIELSSHTDAQGISTYNQKLSQRRAESAKAWLVDQGIDEKRIKPIGYGEKHILNHCKNGVRCSDEEHRENRRTEFKMTAGPESIEFIREN